MKNFDSACEICLINLEFIPSNLENDISQVAAARVDDHTDRFLAFFITQNSGRQVLAFLVNILFKG